MCGKFTQAYSWPEIHTLLSRFVANLETPRAPEPLEAPVTPMRFANVLCMRDGVLEHTAMRWGFAGRADMEPNRPRHMHARAETVDALPTFADAFARRRCVLIVDSFNEGEEIGGKTVQWTITPKDRAPIAIAALFEEWTNGAERLLTFVMLTVPPNPLIARITDRMPAILQMQEIGPWLAGPAAEAKTLLRTHDESGNWDMMRQGKPPRPSQRDLFD